MQYKLTLDVRESQIIDKIQTYVSSIPAPNISISTAALPIGDMLLQKDDGTDILLFERKSFQDLLASIKDGRYEEQSHRIIHTSGLHPHNVIYILEGTFATLRNPLDKRIIQSAMTSLMYFKGFSVMRTANTQETAELIWSICTKLEKEFNKGKSVPKYLYPGISAAAVSDNTATPDTVAAKDISRDISGDISENASAPLDSVSYSNFVKKTKHENITPENIGEIILCQIPGISSTSAAELMRHYGGSIYALLEDINERPEKLETIYFSTAGGKKRKIGSNIVQNLQKYLKRVVVESPVQCV